MRSRLTGFGVAVALLVLATAPAPGNECAVGSAGAVAAEHGLASAAGLELLRAGGNAVDAAVAAALATGVVNPSSSGLGGGGFMLVHLSRDARTHGIDFREVAPGDSARDMYVSRGRLDREASRRGGSAVGVPGEAAGLWLAQKRFGTRSWAEVAAPAIRLARDGFAVEAHLARALETHRKDLRADAALAAEFLHADGTPYREGETLSRPDLATTLEQVASAGAEVFYRGPIAEDIVASVRGRGGSLRLADLASYRPRERSPIVVTYKRWQFTGMPPPSSGGASFGEVLGVLEPYALGDLGQNTATYLHLLTGSLKAAFADRARYYGDPDFSPVPLVRLMSPAHTAGIRERLSATRSVPAREYGPTALPDDGGTSHISVVDSAGNAVSLTTSINTAFGAKLGVAGRGIVLNNTMDDFSAQPGEPNVYGLVGTEANAIAPLKRPLSSMSPTIVLENGAVRAVAGASGGPLIISATLQTLLNVLEFGMPVDRAVDAARIHHQWLPDQTFVEAGVPEVVRASLVRLGHDVRPMLAQAAVQAIEVSADRDARSVSACSDGRKGGVALAY